MYYQHFKGAKYKVLHETVTNTETGKRWVVYRSLSNFEVYTRSYEEFHGTTRHEGKRVKRFTLIPKPGKMHRHK